MTLERMMDIIAEFESCGRFDAWNPADKGKGVSFGKWQFNQLGGLHGLLVRMHKADPQTFIAKFGAQGARGLIDRSTLLKMNLNDGRWKTWFQSAAHVPAFQNCQLEEAVESYAKPAAKLCKEYGLNSWLWLALLGDTCIQYGVGGCKAKLKQAMANPGVNGLLDTFAELTDGQSYHRRHRLIANEELQNAGDWTWDTEKCGRL